MPFLNRVAKRESGCWEWTGSRDKGYGLYKDERAHRASWMLHRGVIPDGMCVCHKCDNKCCVNPDHLFLGTQRDNVQDAIRKGIFRIRRGHENGRAKLTEADVIAIRAARTNRIPVRQVAHLYGIHESTVRAIAHGRKWKHVRSSP